MITRRFLLQSAATAAYSAQGFRRARAENAPGITATEIKFGQTIPLSGPASAYSVVGRAEAAYFRMINEQGGVNGRKLNFLDVDDGYSPPKTVEETRRLVEEEGVAFLFNSVGTAAQLAVRPYLNEKKVRSCFRPSGSSTPNIIRGRCRSFSFTRPKPPSTRITPCRRSLRRRLRSSIRTTISDAAT
jgi:branched-chain amino acid transport system substrate-binding protein